MPAQAGARYVKNERISAAAVEESWIIWINLWRQLPVKSKAELRSLIESYLLRNKPKPAAPPSGVVNGRSSGTCTISLGEAARWGKKDGN
jgi:hypothetical protein